MTTWNSADKGSNIALTNGDLTAVCSDPTSLRFVRSSTGKSTGKWYCEFLCNPIVASFANRQAYVGIAQASVSNETILGSDVPELSWGFFYNSDNTSWHVAHGGGGNDIGGSTPIQGNIIGISLDLNALVFYMRFNGIDLDGGDPVSGTGGRVINAGTWYAAASGRIISSTPGQITANFGATAFFSLPTGFSAWDSTTTSFQTFDVSSPFISSTRQMVGF